MLDSARQGLAGMGSNSNLSLKFSVNTRCHYLLEPVVIIPLYPNAEDVFYKLKVSSMYAGSLTLYETGMLQLHQLDM